MGLAVVVTVAIAFYLEFKEPYQPPPMLLLKSELVRLVRLVKYARIFQSFNMCTRRRLINTNASG